MINQALGGVSQHSQYEEGSQWEVPSPPIHTKGVGGLYKILGLSTG
jgi:hypothetical protein